MPPVSPVWGWEEGDLSLGRSLRKETRGERGVELVGTRVWTLLQRRRGNGGQRVRGGAGVCGQQEQSGKE